MALSLLPDLILDSLTDVTPEELHCRGIRLLMLDFDNTVVPYTTDVPTEAVERWFEAMRKNDIALCMVSNSKKPRVRRFCEAHGIPCIQHARKPFWRCGIRAALERFSVPAAEAAIVGDQIYTDVLGGNSAGATSILVRPIRLHTIWLRLRHVAERPFIAWGKQRIYHERRRKHEKY